MKCQLIHPSLSDYLDDGLPVGEAGEIKDHLDGCFPCRQVLADLGALRQAARELPLRSPHSELWNRIRAGIAQEADELDWQPTPVAPQSWWQRVLDRRISLNLPQLAGAAALVVAVVVTGTYYYLGSSRLAPPNTGQAVGAMLPMIPEETALKARVDKEIVEINQRKASWDPDVRAGFESHLARIDESLKACRVTLAHNAQDRDHQQMYLSLYQEKLRLLEDVNRLKW